MTWNTPLAKIFGEDCQRYGNIRKQKYNYTKTIIIWQCPPLCKNRKPFFSNPGNLQPSTTPVQSPGRWEILESRYCCWCIVLCTWNKYILWPVHENCNCKSYKCPLSINYANLYTVELPLTDTYCRRTPTVSGHLGMAHYLWG